MKKKKLIKFQVGVGGWGQRDGAFGGENFCNINFCHIIHTFYNFWA